MITQSEPGEIFVIRNAGNFIPTYNQESTGEGATIEYALRVLNISVKEATGILEANTMISQLVGGD